MHWLTKTFELQRGGSTENVRPMEGLRGFAVSLVFLVHYAALMLPWIPQDSALVAMSSWLSSFGGTGVDLFFVLSGYLIYGSLIARPQPFFRFMSRRIRRIYPAFTAVFCLYVALSFVFPSENKIPRSLSAGALYLLQNFLLLPGIFHIPPMITVAWSLSYEVFYYLAIPLVIGLFGLRGRSVRWRVAFVILTSAAVGLYCAGSRGPIRLIMFGSGLLLYEGVHNRMRSPGGIAGLIAILCVALAALLPDGRPIVVMLRHTVLFASYLVLCLACFRDANGWLAIAFSWTPLRWLGNISYSYYLLHGLALKGVALAMDTLLSAGAFPWWMYWALMPPMFILTLLPSALLFIGVERPFSLARPASAARVRQGTLNAT